MFFFQAEDGIRDYKVTGVQTCALPISIDAEGRTVHSNTAMAAQAIHDCLAQAGRALGDVGFLASGSSGGDALMPGFANMIQGEMAAPPMETLSVHGVCAARVGALQAAAGRKSTRLNSRHPVTS